MVQQVNQAPGGRFNAEPDGGKVAFLNGIIFGLAAAVLNILLTVGLSLLLPDFTVLWVLLTWIVGLVAFFLAGFFAARRTGRVGTGTLAGLWTGIINGVIPCCVYGFMLFASVSGDSDALFQQVASQSSSVLSPEIMSSAVRAAILMFVTFSILLNIGVAAAVAPLGGLAGRKRVVAEEYKYTPMFVPRDPYTGAPLQPPLPPQAYPPYPAYPPVPPTANPPYPTYPPASTSGSPYPSYPVVPPAAAETTEPEQDKIEASKPEQDNGSEHSED